MAFTTKSDIPLVSSTKFDIPAVSVADETDYSGIVGPGSGDYIAFASMPQSRSLIMSVSVGALANGPTGLRYGLLVADDANGTNAAFVSGAYTDLEPPVTDTQIEIEIDSAKVSDSTKYYGAGVALKGGGTATALLATITRVGDKTHI